MSDTEKQEDDVVKVNQIHQLRALKSEIASLVAQLDNRLDVYDLSAQLDELRKQRDALKEGLDVLKTLQDEHGSDIPTSQAALTALNGALAVALRIK